MTVFWNGIVGSHSGMIVAHGDKCYSYQQYWEKQGIPFAHGVAIYLVSYLPPYNKEVRVNAPDGSWVAPMNWVADNYRAGHKFADFLT